MIAFDGNGSLYVCEWRTYMQDEHATGQLDPVSRVAKLTDTDGDGKMDQRTVFIDTVILPRTVLPTHDRVLVNFTESETIWAYFEDNNKDGISDPAKSPGRARMIMATSSTSRAECYGIWITPSAPMTAA